MTETTQNVTDKVTDTVQNLQIDAATMSQWQDTLIDFGLSFLAAAAIFLIGRFIVGFLITFLKRKLDNANVDTTLSTFACSIINIILLALVIIAALGTFGVETTSFAAILASAGLAVGLALQGSLSNFAAGVMVILFRPFKIGDFVKIAGEAGTVKQIGIFTTTLLNPSNVEIIIPNGGVTSGNITNYSSQSTRRVDLVVGVSYDADIDKVRSVVKEILLADDRVQKNPEPLIAVGELADSSVNFYIRPHTANSDYWGVYFDTLEKIKKRFDAEGIEIPYPQTVMHAAK